MTTTGAAAWASRVIPQLLKAYPALWILLVAIGIWVLWPYLNSFLKAGKDEKRRSLISFSSRIGCLALALIAIIGMIALLTLMSNK